MPKIGKLTPKQERFCREYMIDLNATQACIRAGYSKKTADVIGCENLGKPSIIERIAELHKEREERTQITADKVIKELAILALSDAKDYYDEEGNLLPIHQLPPHASKALAEVTTRTEKGKKGETLAYIDKIKTYDKKGALDSLGKHFGIFEKDNTQKQPSFSFEMEI